MGFWGSEAAPKRGKKGQVSTALLHELECKGCPLNQITENITPHMEPTGSAEPIIYILGEAPGKQEDEQGMQFVGKAGQLLRPHIPKKWLPFTRWNNCVRTRPPANRTPEKIEIECCRPSVVRDIEATKPKAILGFGAVPLTWVCGQTGIYKWRGRRFPVKVGSHSCWYYAFQHPAFLLRMQNWKGESEPQRAFQFDLRRAFDEIESLPPAVVHTRAMAEENLTLLTGKRGDYETLVEWIAWAREQAVVGLDYETKGLRPYAGGAKILTVALSAAGHAIAFPLSHKGSQWGEDTERVEKLFLELLRDPLVAKTSHNLAFEQEWTAYFWGWELLRATRWEDSLTQAAVLDERVGDSKPGCFALTFLTQQYFGFDIKALSTINTRDLDSEPLEDVLRYNAIDAKYHWLLYQAQASRIREERLVDTYEMMLRRIPTVVLTQLKGVPIDQAVVKELSDKYEAKVNQAVVAIQDVDVVVEYKKRTGKAFNPASSKDVVVVYRDFLKRQEGFRNVGGKEKYSVDEETLTAVDHPLSALILQYRKAEKKLSTYISPLRAGSETIYPDGLLHAQINTTFAETGRLSIEGPSLQNWPKRDSGEKETRSPFADPNAKIVAFDYGQIEARVIAMLSKDETFVKMLKERYDVHEEWARRIALACPDRIGGKQNLTDKAVMKALRQDIKSGWTFALVYGAALKTCAYQLGVDEALLKPLYEEFWRQFPGIAKWQVDVVKGYKINGYVECLTGRRRHAPLDRNQCLNSPSQGTATDICMNAMDRLSERNIWELQANIQVHDDLSFWLTNKQIDRYAGDIISTMLSSEYDFVNVPLSVEMSIGDNWADVKEVGAYFSDEWFA